MKYASSAPLAQSGPAALWDAADDYVRVVLRDVEVEARVGLHPWESHPERPHRLLVTIEMFAHALSGMPETNDTIINYDLIHAALKAWPERPHTPLLETLLEELVALCFEQSRVAACRVSIMKPDIFNDTAAVGVEVYRRRPAPAAHAAGASGG